MVSKLIKILDVFFKKILDKNYWLLVIFSLGLLLRIIGTNPGYLNHPDEPKIADSTLNITFHLNFVPVAFYYGSLLPIVYALMNFALILPFYILLFIPTNLALSLLKGSSSTLECILDKGFSFCTLAQSKDLFLYLTRFETAFLSTISILLIYHLGKKLVNTQVGLLAALFTAINYRHVLSSHYALADAPLTVFILISILLSLRLLQNPNLKNYLMAGFGLGLVLSVKYFVYTIPTFLLCHVLANIKSNKYKVLTNSKILMSLGTAIIVFSIVNPYIFLNYNSAKEQFDLNSIFYKTADISAQSILDFDKFPLFSLYYLFKYGLGEMMSLTTIFGFAVSMFRYPKSTLILSSVILPFLYIFLVISGATYVRNYSAILPLILVFPAILISELFKFKSKNLQFATVILILVISLPSLRNSLLTSYSLSQTPNQKLFLEWMVGNIVNDDILVNSFGVPVLSYKPTKVINWTNWPTSFMALEELTEAKVQWAAISSDTTTFIANEFWVAKNDIVQRAFFRSSFLKQYLENTYPNLLIQDLADYRVAEFFKPYWQSPDSSIFISKLPSWKMEEGNKVVSYSFDKESELKDWSNTSILGESLHDLTLSDGEEENRLMISQKNLCPNYPIQYSLAFTKISTKSFGVKPGQWYILSVTGERKPLLKYANIRNGFIRLDFFSKDEVRLKTHVSRQLSAIGKPETISAFGMAPPFAHYGQLSFQLDYCSEGEIYYLDNLRISEVKNQHSFSIKDYPHFGKPIPDIFIWQPPL